MNSLMRASFVWSTPLGSLDYWVLVCKALHGCGLKSTPWGAKVPLVAACFPAAVTEHKLVQAMRDYHDATCRAVAIAKSFTDQYKTIYITKEDGRKVEHLLCANISGDTWLVHPGTNMLSPALLAKHEVKSGAKRRRISASPPLPLEPIMPCAALDKLMSVAHHKAEVERAKLEGRNVDTDVADALFDKDPFAWTQTPKKVHALWFAIEDGKMEQRVDEIPFPGKAL